MDSIDSSIVQNHMSPKEEKIQILSFKDFKGFKEILNIKDRYKIGKTIGSGSFGQVRLALHRKANVKCAIKIINKSKVAEHAIFQNLMDNEL